MLFDGIGVTFDGNPDYNSSGGQAEDKEEEKKDDKDEGEESDEERNKRVDKANRTAILDSSLEEDGSIKKMSGMIKV